MGSNLSFTMASSESHLSNPKIMLPEHISQYSEISQGKADVEQTGESMKSACSREQGLQS